MPLSAALIFGRNNPHTYFKVFKMNNGREILFAGVRGFSFELLNSGDIDEFLALQDIVYEIIPDKDIFVLTTKAECEDSFVNDFCIGAFREGRLAGASIMVLNRESERNLGGKLGYDPAECVTLDTTFIHPDWRGHGLQRAFIDMRIQKATELGVLFAFATVSPDNQYSLANIRSYGFEVLEKGTFYGGYERLVLIKQLRS